jgi:hypothetical protein
MITFGLFASFAAAFAFLCLLFNLAALALPVWVAGAVFFFIQKSGEGLIGASVLGLAAGSATYFAGLICCAMAPSRALSLLIALIFAMPAGAAGYHVGFGLSRLVFVAPVLQQCGAIVSAIFVFALCWRRLSPMVKAAPDIRANKAANDTAPIIDAEFTEVPTRRRAKPFMIDAGNNVHLPSPQTITLD